MNPKYFIELWAPEVANHLWQSTLFAAVAALLAFTLRNYQARTRYWLWLAASTKFLIPFSLLLTIGSHLAWSIHPATSQPAMYAAIDQISQPFTERTLPATSTLPIPTQPSTMLPTILTALWLSGVIAVLAFWSIQLRRVSKSVREAKPLQSGREIEILHRLEHTANLRSPIQLLTSRNSMEPGVVGVLHPVLLWPEGISQHLDDAHLEAILAHEVCHVQRRDNLTSTIHMLVEALFWFHPLVWWLEKRLVDERERACDEAVLQLLKQPKIYAESILKVCELCIESPLTCVSGITGADLKKRIVQIMTEPIVRKLDRSKKLLLGAVCLTTICVPIVFGQIMATQSMALPAPEPPPAQLSHTVGQRNPTQTTNPDTTIPAYDVASIKQSKPGDHGFSIDVTPDGFSARAATLYMLIRNAYGFNFTKNKILGAPAWANSNQYDLEAKVDSSAVQEMSKLSREQRELMLQKLLADRFNLKIHVETRELPAYALVLAKNGPKFHETKPEDHDTTLGNGLIIGQAIPITDLVNMLNQQRDLDGRIVLDRTGLTGTYDISLKWTPNSAGRQQQGEGIDPSATSTPELSAPSLFTEIQEQLGLKLEPAKGLAEVLVVDHAEPPSEN